MGPVGPWDTLYLSDIPAIQPAIFDGLRGKGVITQHRLRINQRTGRYILRVVARNQAGVGPGNTVLVDFKDGKGWCENIQFKPKRYAAGGVSFERQPKTHGTRKDTPQANKETTGNKRHRKRPHYS